MKNKKEEILSLNETALTGISIEDLESRLQMEELDERGEMWTGCGCAEECRGQLCPMAVPNCPGDVCAYVCWRGTW